MSPSPGDMGSNGTKLVTLLKDRKTSEAMALWEESQDLKDNFKPNTPIGWKRRDTLMHLVARAGARDLLRHLLQHGGDPFATNSNEETPIHVACTSVSSDPAVQTERAELLELLLDHVPEASREEAYEVIPDTGDYDSASTYVDDKWNLGVRDKVSVLFFLFSGSGGLSGVVPVRHLLCQYRTRS